MAKRQRVPEQRVLKVLEEIIKIDRKNRDALPGKVVEHIKTAVLILRKRQNGKLRRQKSKEPPIE
ncbi:MAG: hypothetical protein COV07_04105 [Candidatus Vogelbacteria bacterium CG10_big_fil_rev_8_21_14_0_10_45_14]|uniref:Uncharacterized protein n=1 Tax=Candidatus Vogelbacteria bacterium CG10_big_fil_rev_8_21_14_0_10_45_14 TaxID=1975042 RepID=A0A2H0RKB5_9BACT|nr:MAG: hypothetical protein COV07_04105 [Candidatus Vogelbacteria bacterium CG10_big_fil_rev_8_21_14_0_10_45_14]